jgi:DNA-binding NtrC family response regulator
MEHKFIPVSAKIGRLMALLASIKQEAVLMESSIASFVDKETNSEPEILSMDEINKRAITEAFLAMNGNREKTSRRLKIPVRTLDRYIVKYGLKRKSKYE